MYILNLLRFVLYFFKPIFKSQVSTITPLKVKTER